MITALARLIVRRTMRRAPDFIVGGQAAPYMLRWYVTPWSALYRDIEDADKTRWQWLVSRLPCIYAHKFLRSDDDRALHDHPWWWCSILVDGTYTEVTERSADDGRVIARTWRTYLPGSIRAHRATFAHRLEVTPGEPCLTLFITGPRIREWGFHCPKGWVPWRQFVATNDRGAVGAGCGEG